MNDVGRAQASRAEWTGMVVMAFAICRPALAAFRTLFLRSALIAVACVLALAQTADAAPPTPPASDWTGFYLGGNFGYGVGRTRSATDDNNQFERLSANGMIGGGQAGYRVQRNWFVMGAEADFQWSGQKDSSCSTGPSVGCQILFIHNRDSELQWFGTVRGVAGVAHDNWLWTVTGGYAYGSVEDAAGGFNVGPGQTAFGSERTTRQGWAAGTSVETRLGVSNWSIRLDYLYLNLGHHGFRPECAGTSDASGRRPGCDTDPTLVAPLVDSSFSDHIVRIALNYNLGGLRPTAMPAPGPAAVATANWAGFYAGGNVGYGVGLDHSAVQRIMNSGALGLRTEGTQSPAGFIGGGQAGYRFQRGWLVFGGEADFQSARRKDTSCLDCGSPTAINYDDKRDWFGTVRGVLGAAQGSSLWYVTGGFAYGRVSISHNVPIVTLNPIVASSSTTADGWTVGVGVETKLGSSNWSAKLEYLYMNLGDVSFDGFCTVRQAAPIGLRPGLCETNSQSTTDHIARVGLNYTFGSWPP